MAHQLIAVDPDALDALHKQLAQINRRLDEIQATPRPEWVTVSEYATIAKVSERTVLRRIEAGEIEVKRMAGKRMVRV